MKDVITYCADVDALKLELISISSVSETSVDEQGKPVLTATKTPVVYKGNLSLSLIRIVNAEDEEALNLKSIEVLGTYDEVFSDPAKMAKYTSVYSIEPYEITNEDGSKETVTPPKKFGVFYG